MSTLHSMLDLYTAFALICLAFGTLAWVQRKCADWRGRRLPPMRIW